MTSRICFYHKGCSDGIASSWCFQYKYPKALLIGISPQDPNIDIPKLKGKKVYFVDVCTNKNTLIKIIEIAKKITIMDHHEIYENMLEDIKTTLNGNDNLEKLHILFDKKRAACQIVWDKYFDTKRPLIIDYIADRDLWKFELPNSKEINNALFHLSKINYNSLTELTKLTDEEFNILSKEEFIPYSKVKKKLDDNNLSFGIKNACPCIINTKIKYKGWISQIEPTLRSELGNILVNKNLPDGSKPSFAVTYQYSFKHKEWWLSFRGNGSVNLSELCKEIDSNGGGHPNASGLTLKNNNKLFNNINDLFEIIS